MRVPLPSLRTGDSRGPGLFVLSCSQGYAVLVGSCFRSTPQIARIMKANSARGVSLVASLAELVAYSITCAYNLRLGEVAVCLSTQHCEMAPSLGFPNCTIAKG